MKISLLLEGVGNWRVANDKEVIKFLNTPADSGFNRGVKLRVLDDIIYGF